MREAICQVPASRVSAGVKILDGSPDGAARLAVESRPAVMCAGGIRRTAQGKAADEQEGAD